MPSNKMQHRGTGGRTRKNIIATKQFGLTEVHWSQLEKLLYTWLNYGSY